MFVPMRVRVHGMALVKSYNPTMHLYYIKIT